MANHIKYNMLEPIWFISSQEGILLIVWFGNKKDAHCRHSAVG
jgi:hypothetical protein